MRDEKIARSSSSIGCTWFTSCASDGTACSMSGRATELTRPGSPGPGAYNQVEGGEAYSDMTRFGSRSLAKQSQVWASQVGRTSSTPREIDFVHKY